MKLIDGYELNKQKTGDIWTNITGKWTKFVPGDNRYGLMINLRRLCKSKNVHDEAKRNAVAQAKLMILQDKLDSENAELGNDTEEVKAALRKSKLNVALQHLIDFFSEFSFSPNFRFVNTLTRKLVQSNSYNDIKKYVRCYFALTDNIYQAQIADKMESSEFETILDDLMYANCTKQINTRFKLYYGAQGTGKTTQAMIEANNNCMVCHSAMLPSDLMEDFQFDDGKAAFKPSALCKAMTEGKQIVLDEINLLPFESLRFLQSILDGKSSFVYKGQTINIEDGFKIIGTMNLQVNGQIYPLPEPLVDRAEDLKEYKLTAEQLLGAID